MRLRRNQKQDAAASCREVARVLQRYLDGEADETTTRRVAMHLEDCRRCGLELHTYRALKAALVRRVPVVDELAVERLRSFARQIMEAPPVVGSGGS